MATFAALILLSACSNFKKKEDWLATAMKGSPSSQKFLSVNNK